MNVFNKDKSKHATIVVHKKDIIIININNKNELISFNEYEKAINKINFYLDVNCNDLIIEYLKANSEKCKKIIENSLTKSINNNGQLSMF